MDGRKLRKRLGYGALGLLAMAVFAPKASFAIPSFARQTGLACDVCHTVFPHLTPFGREFKLHGYTYDYSSLIKMVRQAAKERAAQEGGMPNLMINKIPMVSVRIAGMWSQQDGGGNVPTGKVNNGQNFSYPADYTNKDTFNLVKGDSLYIAGEITPHIGAWVEIGGWNDSGGSASLAGYNVIFNGGDHTIDNKNFTYGLSFENMVGFGDVAQAGPGNWGINTINPLSTHNTLFDPWPAVIEGGEAYAMIGNFTSGGIYGAFGLYDPTSGNSESYFGYGSSAAGASVGNIAGTTSYASEYPTQCSPSNPSPYCPDSGGLRAAKSVDPYLRLEFWLPGFHNIYSMIGGFGYFGDEKMKGLYQPYGDPYSVPSEYDDHTEDYGIDFQAQYIGNKNLFEVFGAYQEQYDSHFYGQDEITGNWLSGSSVHRNGFYVKADYYYDRTYGVYAKYTYAHSSQVTDLDYSGFMLGVAWYPWQNVKVQAERLFFSKYNPGVARYSGSSASDFDVNAVKVMYLF